jgi:hypothetical protein
MRFSSSLNLIRSDVASQVFRFFLASATFLGIAIQNPLECSAAFIVGGGGLLKQSYANQIQGDLGEGGLTFNSIFSRQSGSSAAELAVAAAGRGNTLTVMEIESLTLYHQNSNSIAFYMPKQVLAWRNTGSLFEPVNGMLTAKNRFDSKFFNLSTGFSVQEASSEAGKNLEFTLAVHSKGGAYALPNLSILHLPNQNQWTPDGPSEAVNPWYTHLNSGFAPLNNEYSGFPSALAYAYASGDPLLQSFFSSDVSTVPFSSADEGWNTKVIIGSFEVYSLSTTPITPEPSSGFCFLAGLSFCLGIFRQRR